MAITFDARQVRVHDFLVTDDRETAKYHYIPISERKSLKYNKGTNGFFALEDIKVVDLAALCKTLGVEVNLENCNELAYVLDKRGDLK